MSKQSTFVLTCTVSMFAKKIGPKEVRTGWTEGFIAFQGYSLLSLLSQSCLKNRNRIPISINVVVVQISSHICDPNTASAFYAEISTATQKRSCKRTFVPRMISFHTSNSTPLLGIKSELNCISSVPFPMDNFDLSAFTVEVSPKRSETCSITETLASVLWHQPQAPVQKTYHYFIDTVQSSPSQGGHHFHLHLMTCHTWIQHKIQSIFLLTHEEFFYTRYHPRE